MAGVLLGFAVPVLRSKASGGPEAGPGLAEVFEHRFRPISAGVAVPIFAFFSAGVAVGGWEGLGSALTDPVAVGIIVALVLGKPIGIMGTTWLLTKVTRARLDTSFKWIDVFGVSLLAGIGFTVSLLVAELSFGHGSLHDDHAKVGILAASVLAALLATMVLRTRNRHTGRPKRRRRSTRTRTGSRTCTSRTAPPGSGGGRRRARGRRRPLQRQRGLRSYPRGFDRWKGAPNASRPTGCRPAGVNHGRHRHRDHATRGPQLSRP